MKVAAEIDVTGSRSRSTTCMQDFCWTEEEEEDDDDGALWSLVVRSIDLYMCVIELPVALASLHVSRSPSYRYLRS